MKYKMNPMHPIWDITARVPKNVKTVINRIGSNKLRFIKTLNKRLLKISTYSPVWRNPAPWQPFSGNSYDSEEIKIDIVSPEL